MSIQHDSLDRYTLRGNLNTTKNSFHFRLYRQTWEELLFKRKACRLKNVFPVATLSFKNMYNPQIQFFAKSETKRPKIGLSHKTKRSENRKRTTPKMRPERVAFLVSTNQLNRH